MQSDSSLGSAAATDEHGSERLQEGLPLGDPENLCKHQVVYYGLCTACGSLANDNVARLRPGFLANDLGLALEKQTALASHEQDQTDLLKRKKLNLVWDLDNTLIHAVHVLPDLLRPFSVSLEQFHTCTAKNSRRANNFAEGCIFQAFSVQDRVFAVPSFIKLRPHLFRTLKKISEKYVMYLYTMGTHEHATTALSIIDPDKRLFRERVFSRVDCQYGLKSLGRIFPIDSKMAVGVDDADGAWIEFESIIKCRPYLFFGPEFSNLRAYSVLRRQAEIDNEVYAIGLGQKSDAANPPHTAENPNQTENRQRLPRYNEIPACSCQAENVQTAAEVTHPLESTKHLGQDKQHTQPPENALLEHEQHQHTGNRQRTKAPRDDRLEPHLPDEPPRTTSKHIYYFESNTLKPFTALDDYEDNNLCYVLAMLEAIHHIFFSEYEASSKNETQRQIPNVTSIVKALRSSVLQGCTVAAVGLPTDVIPHFTTTDMAGALMALGAAVHDDVTDDVTHVILFSHRTKPTSDLPSSLPPNSRTQVPFHVAPAWAEAAIYTWMRPEEARFFPNATCTTLWQAGLPPPDPEYYIRLFDEKKLSGGVSPTPTAKKLRADPAADNTWEEFWDEALNSAEN